MEYDYKRLQKEQLELVKELDRVCRKNNINYYLAAGTLIGAVRHKGFIPWDDDIDVFMYHKDVEMLFQCQDQFKEGYFLQNHDTDPGYRHIIARLRKDGTAQVESDDKEMDCHHGIFLDIYILYYYPDNKLKRAKMCYNSIMYQMLLAERPPLNRGVLPKLIGKLILAPYSIPWLRKARIAALRKSLTRYSDTKRVAILYGLDLTTRRVISYKTKWYGKPKELPFEDTKLMVPTCPKAVLTNRYGDYMTLPPVEERKVHHNFYYVSFDHEYHPDSN